MPETSLRRPGSWVLLFTGLFVFGATAGQGQAPAGTPPPAPPAASAPPGAVTPPPADDPARILVGRLDLERYKATIKGLTQFGDRRQGTDRNRAAVDWIEAQLKSYGCTNTERITYDFQPTPPPSGTPGASGGTPAMGGPAAAPSGPSISGGAPATPGTAPSGSSVAGGAPSAAPPGGGGSTPAAVAPGAPGYPFAAQGGGRLRGLRARTGVNTDPQLQPDAELRKRNEQPTTPGERQEVYCTKVGSVHPEEMYIVGAHMDGHGWGEAANDDGSGTALVMEIARILSAPGVTTERSIRFALWNNEETGLNGARAYVAQRQALQGKEDPPGSGRYPEPKWLGMIQHDMMMFDHGMPRADGTVSPEQRPEADVNIEFQMGSKFAAGAQALAWIFHGANERYATDYPATVGNRMTNTDSTPFMDVVPAISLRENERGTQIGNGWDPHWHQPTDRFSTFGDKDFRLGLNAAQTTLAALVQLAGAKVQVEAK